LTILPFLFAAGAAPASQSGHSAVTESPADLYSVREVTTQFTAGEKIGSKKAGLVCLPNGSIRWTKDLVLSEAELRTALSQGLNGSDGHFAQSESSIFREPDRAKYLIAAHISRAKFDVCATRWGLGDRHAIKGTGRITIDWKVYSTADRSLVLELQTDEGVDQPDASAGGIRALVVKALERSTAAFLMSSKLRLAD